MTVIACWPRVSRCRWCTHPVLRDNDDAWIHASLAYVCRDSSGGLAATTAEPEVVVVRSATAEPEVPSARSEREPGGRR